MADDPAEQAQPAEFFDLAGTDRLMVAGGPQSGRTTFARTLITSLATRFRPDQAHLYVFERHPAGLSDYSRLPHCGGVFSPAEPDRIRRLVTWLDQEVHRRATTRSMSKAAPLPRIVVIIEGWEHFEDHSDPAFPALPTHAPLDELPGPETPQSPTWIPLGVGGPEHTTVGVDLIQGPHLLLLSGPHGSGRTTIAAELAHSLRRAGIGVLAIAPPRSPLPHLLPEDSGVRVLTGISLKDSELRDAAAAFGDGPYAVILDDADHITLLPTQQGFTDAPTLLDDIARLSARGHQALVLTADATPVLTGFPGPLARLINTIVATGNRILLTPAGRPTAVAHNITLEPDQYFTAPPGRGYLAAGRSPVLVQLATPQPGSVGRQGDTR
ncbi:FtsK/SpoIIIE domain-containing protein [Streptomyces sparsogenes]|uniref:ATP-binding protein n=1 Tax=Streptomyces sparsogenes TaxID=67365 RepID=UPI0033CE6B0A